MHSSTVDCETILQDNYDQNAFEQINEQDFEIVLKINDKCIRSSMNEWREKAKYIPSIHKQE